MNSATQTHTRAIKENLEVRFLIGRLVVVTFCEARPRNAGTERKKTHGTTRKKESEKTTWFALDGTRYPLSLSPPATTSTTTTTSLCLALWLPQTQLNSASMKRCQDDPLMQTINRTGARVLSDWVARYSDVVAGEGNGSRRENKKRRRRRGRRRRRRRRRRINQRRTGGGRGGERKWMIRWRFEKTGNRQENDRGKPKQRNIEFLLYCAMTRWSGHRPQMAHSDVGRAILTLRVTCAPNRTKQNIKETENDQKVVDTQKKWFQITVSSFLCFPWRKMGENNEFIDFLTKKSIQNIGFCVTFSLISFDIVPLHHS